jgi:hypothetical protein
MVNQFQGLLTLKKEIQMNKKIGKLFYFNGIAIILAVLFLWILLPRQAIALCAQQSEEGFWVNADPNTQSLTQAELRFTCQDQIHNGQPYPPGPPWHMHLWGACSPTDCDWEEVGAERVTIGNRTYIYAVYEQGFATRYVYADMSLYREGQLWIWMRTDFTDPNRADYETQNWFTKQ